MLNNFFNFSKFKGKQLALFLIEIPLVEKAILTLLLSFAFFAICPDSQWCFKSNGGNVICTLTHYTTLNGK